jgi:hypothetical protein
METRCVREARRGVEASTVIVAVNAQLLKRAEL